MTEGITDLEGHKSPIGSPPRDLPNLILPKQTPPRPSPAGYEGKHGLPQSPSPHRRRTTMAVPSTLRDPEAPNNDPLAVPRLVERISSTIFRIRKAMDTIVAQRKGNLPYQIQDEETRFLITLREAPGKIYAEYNLSVAQIGPPYIKGDSTSPSILSE